MKRIAIITALTVASFCTYGQMPPGPPPAGAPQPPADLLGNYLQLTPDQKAAFKAAHDDLDTQLKTLRQNVDTAQKALHEGIEATTPDPCTIGKDALALKSAHDAIHAAQTALDQKLEALLTPDQKTRYDAFTAALAFIQSHRPGGPGR